MVKFFSILKLKTIKIMRTDLHRPSKINPDDYSLHNHNYLGGDPEVEFCYIEERKRLYAYLNEGHQFEAGSGKGTCQCCGAHAHYVADFIYLPTGNIVRLGHQCADKMHIGDPHAFRTWRKRAADIRKRKAGKAKAKLLLKEDYGLKGLMIFVDKEISKGDVVTYKESLGFTDENGLFQNKINDKVNIIFDMVGNLVKYGSLSENQIKFLKSLWKEVKNFDAKTYFKKQKEIQDAKPILKIGKREVEGKIISFKSPDAYSQFPTTKMLVEMKDGTRVFGSLPSKLSECDKGDIVKFTATVKVSKNDHSFGFYSRPMKPKIVKKSS